MRTVAGRMFLVLVLATVAIQVLSFGGVLLGTGRVERMKRYEFLSRDLAFMQRFLRGLPAGERASWLPSLNRGFYELRLQSADERNLVVHDTALDETAASVRRHLPGEAVQTVVFEPATAALPGLQLRVDDAQNLLVLFPDRQPPYPAPAIGTIVVYVALVSLTVMAVAWFAVRLVTRPLHFGAQAARALAANLDAPPIPERGPAEVLEVVRAFNSMQQAIRRHLDERTRILVSITHDLKTPLTRLRLRVGALDADERRTRIEADLDTLNALVQEGLDYAHSAQLRESIVPVDLNTLVESIAERATDIGQDVRVEGRREAPLRCAPRALERALQNLVDNAVKYGNRARIVLEASAEQVEIRVEDDGPGLPDALLTKVFEPFYRAETSRSRETGGTGLGLAIAKNLVQAQGGEIRLVNRTPHGLAACVTLKA